MPDNAAAEEFLIKLGYKIDQEGQRRYSEAIQGIQRGAAVLITSMTAAAVGVANAVEKLSSNLAGISYQAQALHASEAGLEALNRTWKELRGSTEEGEAAFATFADRVRSNPLFRAYIENATGKPFPEQHVEEAFVDILDVYQKKRAAATSNADVAVINAEFERKFGISSRFIDTNMKYAKEVWLKHRREIDPSFQKATEDARKLQVSIDALSHSFRDLAIAAAAPLFAPVKELFIYLKDWIRDNREELKKILVETAEAIRDAAKDLETIFGPALKAAKKLWDEFTQTIKDVTGDEVDITGMKGLRVILTAILALVTYGAMVKFASFLMMGFVPFGWLAGVLAIILATLTAIQARFGTGEKEIVPPGTQVPGTGSLVAADPALFDQWARGRRPEGAASQRRREFGHPHINRPGAGGGIDTGPVGGGGGVKAAIDAAAAKYHVDPRVMYGIVAGESAHGNRYDIGDISTGLPSYGPFQMRIAGPGSQGYEFMRATGQDPRNPSSIPAQAEYIAKRIASGGSLAPWAGYHGPREWSPRWGSMGVPAPGAAPMAVAGVPPPAAAAPAVPPRAPPASTGGGGFGIISPAEAAEAPQHAPVSDLKEESGKAWMQQHFPQDKPLGADVGKQSMLHLDQRSVSHDTKITVAGGDDVSAPAVDPNNHLTHALTHLAGASV
jgi:hypothetical protein